MISIAYCDIAFNNASGGGPVGSGAAVIGGPGGAVVIGGPPARGPAQVGFVGGAAVVGGPAFGMPTGAAVAGIPGAILIDTREHTVTNCGTLYRGVLPSRVQPSAGELRDPSGRVVKNELGFICAKEHRSRRQQPEYTPYYGFSLKSTGERYKTCDYCRRI
jgi:hypothetical protein